MSQIRPRTTQPKPTPRPAHSAAARPAAPVAQVRLSWLLTSLGLLVLAALCCAYLSLCLLFAQGAWQLLYQPSHTLSTTPASRGLPFTPVRFGINDGGVAELTGWWIPAESPDSTAVLYLHDGSGSLAETLPDLAHLHALGCSVLAFDYRGFGASSSVRPSEQGMIEDAQRAISYLENTRHIPAGSLVLWGRGTGAVIAAEVAAQDHPFPLILEGLGAPALELLRSDGRLRFLPVRLLLKDRLDPEQPLRTNNAAKLFLVPTDASPSNWTSRSYTEASGPKRLADLSDDAAQRAFLSSVGTNGTRSQSQPGGRVTTLSP